MDKFKGYEYVTAVGVIDFLNELVKIDAGALKMLIDHRVICNEELALHPTVQVRETDDCYLVGMLGILNGLFGVDENEIGFITAVFQEGELVEFVKTNKVYGEGGNNC